MGRTSWPSFQTASTTWSCSAVSLASWATILPPLRMGLKRRHANAFGVLGWLPGRSLNSAQPDDISLPAGESLHPIVPWVGSHQPVPLARPIFSFEELCPCLVPFPSELNFRLRMSTQVKYPCRDGWLRNVGIGHDHLVAVSQITHDYRARLATATPHGSEEQTRAADQPTAQQSVQADVKGCADSRPKPLDTRQQHPPQQTRLFSWGTHLAHDSPSVTATARCPSAVTAIQSDAVPTCTDEFCLPPRPPWPSSLNSLCPKAYVAPLGGELPIRQGPALR